MFNSLMLSCPLPGAGEDLDGVVWVDGYAGKRYCANLVQGAGQTPVP